MEFWRIRIGFAAVSRLTDRRGFFKSVLAYSSEQSISPQALAKLMATELRWRPAMLGGALVVKREGQQGGIAPHRADEEQTERGA